MLVDGHNLGFDRLLDLLGVRTLEARILGIDDRRQQRFAADLARDHDALVDDVELIQILLQLLESITNLLGIVLMGFCIGMVELIQYRQTIRIARVKGMS